MAFTAQDVKNLRERTSCGMMDCKKALTETGGDMEKAIEYLREKGLAASGKKASRIAAEGTVYAYVDESTKIGVVIEVNAETDFVAKNADFMAFVTACAETVAKENPADVDALAECKIAGSDMTVADMLREKILTIGENIKIRRFVRYEGNLVSYIHMGGKIGVLVKFDVADEIAAKDEFAAFAKDVAMHIAFANPAYMTPDEVPAEAVEKEKAILSEQLRNDEKNANKPAAVIEKIVTGRIGKFFEEICLVKQAFVKDDKQSVEQYVAATAKALGGDIAIAEYTRFEKGDGLEKREDDFAEEVAKMTGAAQ